MNSASVVQFNAATTIGGGKISKGKPTNYPIPGAAVNYNLPKNEDENETNLLQVKTCF